jgi:hypothetical protein
MKLDMSLQCILNNFVLTRVDAVFPIAEGGFDAAAAESAIWVVLALCFRVAGALATICA